ncbi:DNA helicase II [Nitrosomonas sp. HPC101]|uniref:UvrD-helicase domain-containing protein n=1 Tax=Nitrosomonas sp. HPC101 TaxID=1658667 RepID=UPI00136C157A|nr:UvrD-helicase domain-containing protein [Nitrosomonas sp. HPC101]MXS84598.1 DNA helicase II [Nitrosomonas sp. HPC101]
MTELLTDLNPEQLEAVTWPHRSALVLAGAGSGKTRVLTTRIAYLLQSGFTQPQNILAVTFTNKAAREMGARISAMLPVNIHNMWIGTFHGLCHRMLRAHHEDAGLPQAFQILDMADQLAVIKRILKERLLDEKALPARQLQWFINNAKEEGLRASQVNTRGSFNLILAECYQAYEVISMREGTVDFAELLLRCYELLSRNQILRDHYRNRFEHILVDEFQDTNQLQYKWIKLLAGSNSQQHAALFAVGDDDQSIYAFRGARVGNMRDLEKDFSVPKIIRLEQNYRSQGNILDAANALIENNKQRLGKNLWTAAEKGESVRVYHAATDMDETGFIIDEIKALHAEGLSLSEMALLYRSNAQSRVLEHGLFNASISYRVYGGMRFFDRQEVKHALAYLRLIALPNDDNALLRIINFPPRGIGTRTLEQLQDQAGTSGIGLWQAALQVYESGKAAAARGGQSGRGIAGFVSLVLSMQQACAEQPLPEIIRYVVDQSGLVAHYQAEREGNNERLENLKELVNAAISFVHESEDDSLTAFLAHASLEGGEHQAEGYQDAVQLMTVHAAKGLEFHSVFISGLEEGLFPHENSRNEPNGLEEERRLMYVAMTRARQRLYLSHAESRMLHGQVRVNVPSRFVDEIPNDLLKRLRSGFSGSGYAQRPPRAGQNVVGTTYSRQGGKNTPVAATGMAVQGLNVAGFHIGQQVSHTKFGTGTIVNYEGSGHDMRVQVNFRQAGTKWLSLAYAKLVPLS